MIKGILFAAMVVATWPVMAQETAKGLCDRVQREAKDIQSQLPIQIDFATQMTGYNAIYADGGCTLIFMVLMDSKTTIDGVIRGWNESTGGAGEKLTREKAIESMNSGEARKVMSEAVYNSAKEEYDKILSIDNVRIRFRYDFSMGDIRPIHIILE